ncbi:MAG: dihydrofolate reductase [Candidatus Saccharibacteria bacterium]|nr:dihydrofolate reductase [Candidatus Saccharibacteria bacterium]
MKSIVVAYDAMRTIGRNGDLPWAGKLPADLKHFKELTEGRSVIMGRKTFESLPEAYRPLPNRQNIVMSLSATAIKGAVIARSLEEAYEYAGDDAMVIGGADIYRQALPTVDIIYATEIFTRTVKGDAFFPPLPMSDWCIDSIQDFEADNKNKYDYSFVTFIRRKLIEQSDLDE